MARSTSSGAAYAAQVFVPRWYCTVGTLVAVVAAESKEDALAIVGARVRARGHEPLKGDVRVRRLRADDEDRLAAIGEAVTLLGGRPSRY